MSSHKSGYEIRTEVLKVAAEICQIKFKDHPNFLTEEKIIETAKNLYSFVLDKRGESGVK